MLFPYKYVEHDMEKMQAFVDFIFFEVWCKAPIGLKFSLDLFNGEPNLKEVLVKFGFSRKPPKRGKQFYEDIKDIYGSFSQLDSVQIELLKKWYEANNDIERICANDPTTHIVRYADIRNFHPELYEKLASFFKGLYSEELLGRSALREKIGQIDNHYKKFMEENRPLKCPFCGITDMLSVYHSKREAYDHYLPKGLYPFNSINFKNLVPACHYCNSSYKTTQDPSYSPKDPAGEINRRKSFYPYATVRHNIEITIALNTVDVDRMTEADIRLDFGPAEVQEEIETWREVYGIDERYRGKLLNGDAKAWLVEVFDEWRWNEESFGEEGRNPSQYLRELNRHTSKSPYANSNFIKKAFLEGCRRAGGFDSLREIE